MTPPAAATARRATHPARSRVATPARPRRVSGPSRRATVAAPRPLVMRVAGAVHTVAEHRFLDRVIRGRMWIAILGVGLIGIVFMQVSMLRMNAGIGRAVEQATTLERQNAALQASISQLSSGDRIQSEAGKLGLVLPAAGSVRFLDARDVDFRRAARGIEPPGSHPPQPAAAAPAAGLTIADTGVAPSQTTTTASEPPATTTTAPATSTTPAPATAQQTTTQPQPAAQPQPQPTPTAAPAVATGGATAGQEG